MVLKQSSPIKFTVTISFSGTHPKEDGKRRDPEITFVSFSIRLQLLLKSSSRESFYNAKDTILRSSLYLPPRSSFP